MTDKVSKPLLVGIIVGVIAVAILGSSILLPWWGTHSRDESGEDIYEDGESASLTHFGYNLGGSPSAYTLHSSVSTLLLVVISFLIIGLLSGVLFVLFAMLNALDSSKGKTSIFVFGAIAAAVCLLAPVVFMVGLPMCMESDARQRYENWGQDYEEPEDDHPSKSFFGSVVDEDDEDDVTTWGPDIGWWFTLVSLLLFIVALVFVLVGSRRSAFSSRSASESAEYRSLYEEEDAVIVEERKRDLPPPPPWLNQPPGSGGGQRTQYSPDEHYYHKETQYSQEGYGQGGYPPEGYGQGGYPQGGGGDRQYEDHFSDQDYIPPERSRSDDYDMDYSEDEEEMQTY